MKTVSLIMFFFLTTIPYFEASASENDWKTSLLSFFENPDSLDDDLQQRLDQITTTDEDDTPEQIRLLLYTLNEGTFFEQSDLSNKLNVRDKHGWTLLMYTCDSFTDIAHEVLYAVHEDKSDPNIRSTKKFRNHPAGTTAAMIASSTNNVELISLLVSYGADFKRIKNVNKQSAYDLADKELQELIDNALEIHTYGYGVLNPLEKPTIRKVINNYCKYRDNNNPNKKPIPKGLANQITDITELGEFIHQQGGEKESGRLLSRTFKRKYGVYLKALKLEKENVVRRRATV